jgi:hypothetical protein
MPSEHRKRIVSPNYQPKPRSCHLRIATITVAGTMWSCCRLVLRAFAARCRFGKALGTQDWVLLIPWPGNTRNTIWPLRSNRSLAPRLGYQVHALARGLSSSPKAWLHKELWQARQKCVGVSILPWIRCLYNFYATRLWWTCFACWGLARR